MSPRAFLVTLSIALMLAEAAPAHARQGGPPVGEAGPAPAATHVWPSPPPSATTEPAPRSAPSRGPSVRERGGRRSRGSSVASGALVLFILVGAMGYYVMRRLRR